MKKIFDWMREQIAENSVYWGGFNGVHKVTATKLINEAQAKWEVEKKWERCEWKLEDAEANLYVTSCEQRQLIFDGTPTENDYKFCPYCGRKIAEVE